MATEPLRTDLDSFLYAPIADDPNGMPLTMISALGRLGVDPWAEAAVIHALSRESATQKVTSLLSAVKHGPAPGAATETLAARLVELLHSKPRRATASAGVAPAVPASPLAALALQPKRTRWAIYSVVALTALLVGHWALTDRPAATPADTSLSESR
jgi:hypothetical protein